MYQQKGQSRSDIKNRTPRAIGVKKKMKATINHEAKTISVTFSKKSEMAAGREKLSFQKRFLAENGLSLMSGYAFYMNFEMTAKQQAAAARRFDLVVSEANQPELTDEEYYVVREKIAEKQRLFKILTLS